jgi:hypothetical protein
MTEQVRERTGAEAIVREGEEAFAQYGEQIEKHGPMLCWVTLPGTDKERCPEMAVMVVYGKPFCEAHGAEAKSGALEELYYDAALALENMEGVWWRELNPEVLRALRASRSELFEASIKAQELGDSTRRQTYPLRRDLMDEDFRDFDYEGGETLEGPDRYPEDWLRHHRMIVHKLMRIAYTERFTSVVDYLEREERQHIAEQLAYVEADYEERVGPPTVKS